MAEFEGSWKGRGRGRGGVAAWEGSLIGWATPAATRVRFENGVAQRYAKAKGVLFLKKMLGRRRYHMILQNRYGTQYTRDDG